MAPLQVKVLPLEPQVSVSRRPGEDACSPSPLAAIMSTAVEATGFIMCLISWMVTGASLVNDYWKVSTVAGNVITAVRQFENLWHTCAENSASLAQCQDFESLLALDGYVQACRALMIVSLLLGLAALVVALLGLKCIKIGSTNDQTKAKIVVTGGVLAMLGGVCCMVAVSWYAHRVVQDFYNPFNGGIKYELGTGLYLGWAGAALSVLGGGLLCCACRRMSSGAKKGGYFGNTPAKVYTGAPKSEPESRAYV